VAALGFGTAAENGHACFKRGEIALILGKPGEPYQNVKRAIADAMEFGWLAENSFHRCLIVPRNAIRKGTLEAAPKPCLIHSRKPQTPHQTWDSAANSNPRRGIGAQTPRLVSGSERAPLSLICSPTSSPTDREVPA
jgi:hypothetical protein